MPERAKRWKQADFEWCRILTGICKFCRQFAREVVESLRMIKEPGEIKIMRKACAIADECLKRLVKTIKVGVSEDELEWNLLRFARQLGADGFSFRGGPGLLVREPLSSVIMGERAA